jgi:hypothetical protein
VKKAETRKTTKKKKDTGFLALTPLLKTLHSRRSTGVPMLTVSKTVHLNIAFTEKYYTKNKFNYYQLVKGRDSNYYLIFSGQNINNTFYKTSISIVKNKPYSISLNQKSLPKILGYKDDIKRRYNISLVPQRDNNIVVFLLEYLVVDWVEEKV